ncbi:hypothetical protein CANINC_000693 [Pichia inconspicua]|uniref:Rab-GAP TBC domain-containing protein n=1 Tax=Pichia inconspicua TaxID=52247 RepID=A0A4T0X6T2_9ASCO|nr:hypothetical protein CANINC_000693 [[Candida] inconspicua]
MHGLGIPHTRKASISTAISAASTTYGVLDFYAEDGNASTNVYDNSIDDGNDAALTDDNHSTNHRPLMISLLNSPLSNKKIDMFVNDEQSDSTSATDIETNTYTKNDLTDNTTSTGNIAPKGSASTSTNLRKSASSITKCETLEDITRSRAQLAKFKKTIAETLIIKDRTSSFSTPFRPKLKSVSLTLKNSIKNSDYDRYGFKKTNQYITMKDYNDWWDEYCPYLVRRKVKWIKFFEKNGLKFPESNTTSILSLEEESRRRFPTKSNEMAKFVKKGIPAEIRGDAWFSFVHGYERLNSNKDLYEKLVRESIDLVTENTDAIEKDLHRTFPDNIYFKNVGDNKESPMLTTLRRILKVFSIYKPSIGYCQSLNFIAGLLLIFLNEEKTFWMLVIICERFLPGVHEHNLEGLAVNQGMLMLCLKQHLPDVWKIIMENDMEDDEIVAFEKELAENGINENDTSYLYFLPTLTFCTTSWFMSLFIGVLPIETTLRVWDIIFYENSKTIFQVSLGIFKMLDPELKKLYNKAHTNSNGVLDSDLASRLTQNHSSSSLQDSYNKDLFSSDLFQMIQNTPKRIINVNLFIEECYRHDSSSFSKLSQQEINRCHEFVISSRERHAALVEKRNELGMSHAERKQLLRQDRKSGPLPLWTGQHHTKGLKTAYWNVGLNRRLRKIYSKGNIPYN